MSKKVIIRRENKAIEYPVIYSYIYEREKEDILRLAEGFKNSRKRKKGEEVEDNRIIVGYKIEKGKAVPIYESRNERKKVTTLKTGNEVVVRRSGVTVKGAKTNLKSSVTVKRKSTSDKK